MRKKSLKYISIVLGVFVLLIIYLSTVGVEAAKFNNQIQDLGKQENNKFDQSLQKVKLTLDTLKCRIKVQTIATKITLKGQLHALESNNHQLS